MSKRKPTPEYLKQIEEEIQTTKESLESAKIQLFEIVAEAKLEDSQFENWRTYCLDLTDKLIQLEKTKRRIERALDKSQINWVNDV